MTSPPPLTSRLLLNCLMLLMVCLHPTTASLHSKLRHFEILSPAHMRTRTKRDVTTGQVRQKSLHFRSLGREFHLSLTPGGWRGVHPRMEAKFILANGSSEPFNADLSQTYSGRVYGRPRSHVTAFQHDMVWTAYIRDVATSGLVEDVYLIESLHWYLPHTTHRRMLIYRSRDVMYNTTIHNNTMADRNRRASKNHNFYNRKRKVRLKRAGRYSARPRFRGASRYSATPPPSRDSATTTPPVDISNMDCDLRAYVDTEMYQTHFNSDFQLTYMTVLYYYSVVAEIFFNTNFTGFTNMTNRVASLVIMKEYSDEDTNVYRWNLKSTVGTWWDPNNLIDVLEKNPDDGNFCLVHLTHVKKTKELVLGLAYLGSTDRGHMRDIYNGICGGGQDSGKNRNVGWSGKYLHGGIISDGRYLTTLAHELGHNWGASHDDDTAMWRGLRCNYGDLAGGFYLMWPISNYGTQHNNHMFSPCSIRDISALLKTRAHKCFLPRGYVSLCGNGIVERGEDCDDGHLNPTETSQCCTKNCRLAAHAVCTPYTSPCCDSSCRPAGSTKVCTYLPRPPCGGVSYCDGRSFSRCPRPQILPDDTACQTNSSAIHAGTGLCRNGLCVSHCERKGLTMSPQQQLQPCTCVESRSDMCSVCCRNMKTGQCKPTKDLAQDGSMCFLGYCEDGLCRTSHFLHGHQRIRGVLSRRMHAMQAFVITGLYVIVNWIFGSHEFYFKGLVVGVWTTP